MKRYLVIGAGGQLADSFTRILTEKNCDVVSKDIHALDITNRESLEKVIQDVGPDVILNCAAYTLVDQAEDDSKIAFAVNDKAVGDMAEICCDKDIFLVHFGTDYVFDGQKNTPYREDDETCPINVYGESKLAGEERILKSGLTKFLILRLSWVFGPGESNFLFKLDQWSAKNDVLRIVDDEISTPTYTDDVVDITWQALNADLTGLYHCTNTGQCSRYGLAKHYFELIQKEQTIIPVLSTEFSLKAKRPMCSVLANTKISEALKITIPTWQDAVARFVLKDGRGEREDGR